MYFSGVWRNIFKYFRRLKVLAFDTQIIVIVPATVSSLELKPLSALSAIEVRWGRCSMGVTGSHSG